MKKRLAVLGIILIGLSISLAGLGVVTGLILDSTLEPYPSTMDTEARHINWSSLPKSYVSQEAAYQTNDDVMKVWHRYAQQFGVAPIEGMGAEDRCVQLTKTDKKVVFRSELTVRLCPVTHGTHVFFNQVLYLLR